LTIITPAKLKKKEKQSNYGLRELWYVYLPGIRLKHDMVSTRKRKNNSGIVYSHHIIWFDKTIFSTLFESLLTHPTVLKETLDLIVSNDDINQLFQIQFWMFLFSETCFDFQLIFCSL
jgi:hypothetical protein